MSWEVAVPETFADWQKTTFALLERKLEPSQLLWKQAQGTFEFALFADRDWTKAPTVAERGQLPNEFLPLAKWLFHYRSEEKWDLLYRAAYRLRFESPRLLTDPLDPDNRLLRSMHQELRRDAHKMKAFVRFKKQGERFEAWYKPDHITLPLVCDFFKDRFLTMHWRITTPDTTAEWNGQKLTLSKGEPLNPERTDDTDELWRAYYRSTFNPTRPRVKAMKKEMPVRFWQGLPESREIARALREAPARAATMAVAQAPSAQSFVPQPISSLGQIARALQACEGCPLSRSTTHRVAGEGPADAELVFVGEQPGDEEDLQGRPFVGPAGRLLMQAFAEVGIDRTRVYLTNSVKDFKYQKVGKRRLHQRPKDGEVAACRPWLTAELNLVRPRVLVCLGQTAAFSVLGRHQPLTAVQGKVFRSAFCESTIVTRHPSSVLRTEDPALKKAAWEELLAGLRLARASLPQNRN